jgi:hypothetical protein
VIRENTAVWRYEDQAIVLQADAEKKISRLTLGNESIPDVNDNNNLLEPDYE